MRDFESVRRLFKCRNGQLSIEFIAGFFIFILIVSFIVYTVIRVFPTYHLESKYNALREDAWALSENVYGYLHVGDDMDSDRLNDLDFKIVHPLNPTAATSYAYYKELFGVDMDDDFRITVTINPVLVTERGTNGGAVSFEGLDYDFSLNADCDELSVTNTSGFSVTANALEGTNEMSIGSHMYVVDRIDSSCEYAILRAEVSDCGKPISLAAESSKVTRFSNYQGFMAKIDVVYW